MVAILPPQAQNVKITPGTPIDREAAKDVKLFQSSTIKSVTLPNRIVVAPMCMYVFTTWIKKCNFWLTPKKKVLLREWLLE